MYRIRDDTMLVCVILKAADSRYRCMDSLDCVVIGAGVVGLSVARSLALAGRDVVVLEAEEVIALHASSRNSEVIHAGIYYAADSLKARLCVTGKDMLYRYCEEHAVAHRRTGKFIVATTADEQTTLQKYLRQAQLNGVDDLEHMSAREIALREPEIRCVAGLWSPGTGIIDSHAYLLALQADLEAAGGSVVCRSRVSAIDFTGDRISLSIEADPVCKVRCNILINSAGLWAQQLASGAAGFASIDVPQLHMSKGHYYSYQGRAPFQSLVYPIASGGGLGIHATCDLSGGIRFGPDARWVDTLDYEFDDSLRNDFETAIRQYYPGLCAERLQPGYTGIRPKLSGPGESAADFVIQGEAEHGVAGLLNLFGIESPGLTASLAIGEYVQDRLLRAR